MASSSIAGERQDDVANFCSLTGSTPEQAKFYLEASSFQFDTAVGMFFDQDQRGLRGHEHEGVQPLGDAALESGDSSDGEEPIEELAGRGQGRGVQPDRGNRASNEPQHLQGRAGRRIFPINALHRGLQIAFHTLHATSTLIATLGSQLLPRAVVRNLQGGLRSIVGGPRVPLGSQASEFIQQFERQYGQSRPHWQEKSWSDASRIAQRQFKLLYVYLHSPHHQDTETFCRETFTDLEFLRAVNSTFVCWAGDIRSPDAFMLSQKLRVTSYPYNALLAIQGSRMRLIAAAEGLLPPAQLLNLLQRAQERQAGNLVAEQAQQNEQAGARRLREEQDAEYLRGLEADRQKEEQRQQEERRKAEAREAAEQAAAQERALKEQEERRVADRVSTLRNRRASKASQLSQEPPPGSPGCIHIRVRLPDGRNFQRRFLAADPLQRAFDFVDSLESLDALKYSLVTSYPRQVFNEDACSKTFEELGLSSQATFFVQSQDD